MKTQAIVNWRGGAGKTATAHAIGAGLAHLGYRVLFIDMDGQTNLSYDLGADQRKPSTMDILTGAATVSQAIQHKDKWDLIPASPALAAADTLITASGKEYRLKAALESVQDEYQYCIIDTPPALNTLTVNALTAADAAIIPAQAEIHSIQGIGLLNETIQQVKKHCNRALRIDGILITRYTSRAVISRDMRTNLQSVAKQLGTRLYSTPIRECIAVKEAQAVRQDIYTYAPRSNAARDYAALLSEILNKPDLYGQIIQARREAQKPNH